MLIVRFYTHGDYNRSEEFARQHSHAEFFTQIKPSDFCVFCQVCWLTGSKDSTLCHDVCAICHAKCLTHIVIRYENTNPSASQIEYDVLNVVHRLRVDPGKWFIKQNVLRFGCKRSSYLSAPPLTA